jgi:F0F1-type ATP synthase membrane subunit c/vacuolar-type H+-ATPase subunit K
MNMFEPSTTALLGVGLAILVPIIAAAFTIITCGTAIAGVGIKKPGLLSRLIITVVLGEALAIYGLLIAFMLLSKLPMVTSVDAANKALMAGIIIAVASVSACAGISYSGTSLAGATLEREETFSSNVIGVVLSEALAIYGLLISFMIIGQI